MLEEVTVKEFANGLREVADFLEAHPDMPLPEPRIYCYAVYNKQIAALVAKSLADGGRVNKLWSDSLLTLSREFGPIELSYLGSRSSICERVQVATRKVPEEYVPYRPAQEAQVIPEHEEPVYEWRCAPLLGKPAIEIDGTPELQAVAVPQLEADNESVPF